MLTDVERNTECVLVRDWGRVGNRVAGGVNGFRTGEAVASFTDLSPRSWFTISEVLKGGAVVTKDKKDCIIEFRDKVENILMDAGVNDWTERFDAKNKIVDAAIQYGAKFASECLLRK